MTVSINISDITERLDMLEALLKTAPTSILQVSSDLRIIRSNGHFQMITGYLENELEHMSLLDLIPTVDRVSSEADFNRRFDQEKFQHHLQRLLRRDGSELWVRMNGHLLSSFHVDALPTMLIALEDVSDLVSSQERILLSQRADESIAAATDEESALKGILIALCESLGSQVAAFWRANDEGSLAITWDYATEPKRYDSFLNTSRSMKLATGEGLPGRVLQSSAPEWIETLASDMGFIRREHARTAGLYSGIAFPVCLEGRPLGIIETFSSRRRQFSPALVEDLVKLSSRLGLAIRRLRKQSAFRALEEEHNQFQDVVNSITLVVATNVLGYITYANDLFCKHLGYSREELLTMDIHDLQGSLMSPETVETLWATVARGETWMGETCNIAKDGRILWFETTWKGMRGPDGQVDRYVSLRFDISDRKLAEEKMVHSAKLAALGEIAANIAHEINSPLTAIHARAKLTRSALDGEAIDRTTLMESLERMIGVCERIFKITQGLKRISRYSENDDFEIVSVGQLLDDTLSFAHARLRETNIGLQLPNIAAARSLNVGCRPAELSQVLINLINNACDAIQDQAQKWLRIETQILQNGFFEVWVTDSGHGIPPEVASRIMEPFFTTKDSKHGTGLGLSISKKIIEEHGGRLELDSQCENTRFIIRLPLV